MSFILGQSRIAVALSVEHSTLFKKWSSVLFLKRQYAIVQKFERENSSMFVGTIGDHGHGKTTLTSAITKVLSEKSLAEFTRIDELDRAPLEKSKMMTIDPALLSYSTETRIYTHVDLPGAPKYHKNMIRDVSALDSAIFVVSALDGISANGKENLLLARHYGVKNVVVFINKTDATTSDLVEVAEIEVQDVLESTGYDAEKTPIISGSALAALEGKDDDHTGKKSILNLLNALDSIPVPTREVDKPCLLNITKAFSVPGIGTVVRGKLEKGKIHKGDKLVVFGYGYRKEDTVAGLEVFRNPIEESLAGDCISVQLRKIRKADIKIGMVACTPGTYQECDCFEGEFTDINESFHQEPIDEDGTRRKLFSKSWEADALLIPTNTATDQSSKSRMKICLPKPLFLEVGQPLILYKTIREALGFVTQVLPNLTEEEREDYFIIKKRRKNK